MKNNILIVSVILLTLLTTSFKVAKQDPNVITITVSGDESTVFNMTEKVNSKQTIILTSQTVPFEMKVKVSEAKFLFKAQDLNSKMKVEITQGNGVLTADWSTSIFEIGKGMSKVYGMNAK
jgi:hypothetical protein